MKVILLFTYKTSLKIWDETGILQREIFIYKILNKQNNVHYSLITYGDNSDLLLKDNLEEFSIIPVKTLITSKIKILTFLKSFLLPIKLKSLFMNCDIIKSNQIEGSWVAILAKILYKKKFILRAGYEWLRNYRGSMELKKNKNNIKYYLKSIYIYIMEFISYRFADKIIFSNKSDQIFAINTFFLSKKRKRIEIIPNNIDTNLFKPLDLKKKEKHFLFIGRLSNEKNLENLLFAFRDLPHLKLDIIGKGLLEKELKQKVTKFNLPVNFLGLIPNHELPKIINQYTFFILPSFYEGNPKSLLEAMSCGLICIGANVRGIKEIIKDGKNGFLCELDSNSIKNIILKLINHVELYKEIGQNAREYIIKNHSLDTIIEKEYKLYRNLV